MGEKIAIKLLWFKLFLNLLLILKCTSEPQASEENNREGRVIVRIDGQSCTSGVPNFSGGYCDGWLSCYANKGLVTGFCTGRLGSACCLVRRSCGATVSMQTAYFHSRGYPSPTDATGTCEITIEKNYRDITQLKLDFESFNLDNPNSAGICAVEKMEVLGTNPSYPVPTICGNNDNQHMYLNFDGDTITLKFTLSGISGDATKWNIKMTQIRPIDADKPPDGCLQYYRSAANTVSSFGSSLGTVAGQHISSSNYDICIEIPSLPCTITWTFTTLDISTQTANGNDCVNTPNDYVTVEGAPYCAQSATPIVVSTDIDYRLHVSFDSNETPEAAVTPSVGRTGFVFSYTRSC